MNRHINMPFPDEGWDNSSNPDPDITQCTKFLSTDILIIMQKDRNGGHYRGIIPKEGKRYEGYHLTLFEEEDNSNEKMSGCTSSCIPTAVQSSPLF